MFKLNRLITFLLFISLFLLSLQVLFSIGLYDNNGKLNYFVNSSNPTINITVNSMGQLVNISNAKILFNNQNFTINISSSKQIILPGDESSNFIFKLKDFDNNLNLNESNNNFSFKLSAKDLSGKPIITDGDPISFNVVYDSVKPILTNFNDFLPKKYMTTNDYLLSFQFSEPIFFLSYKLNGVEIYNNNLNLGTHISSYKKDFIYDKIKDYLIDGENNFSVEFSDFSGNKNKFDFFINYNSKPYNLSLLTLRDDPSLKYNFDTSKPNLFTDTIYTSSDSFTLKVNTSKKSECYFSSSFSDFNHFSDISSLTDSYSIMSSSDYLIHSVDIDINNDNKIWIFCRNKNNPSESTYLSYSLNLGDKLINIEKYTNTKLKIISILPEKQVTSIPFNLEVQTDYKSSCEYSVDSIFKGSINTLNFINHNISQNPTTNKIYSYDISCFDVLNNKDNKIFNLNVDNSKGVKIIESNPKYTDTSSVNLNLKLSEDASCRFSLEEVSVQSSSNFSLLTGSGLVKTASLSNLKSGNNDVFIYCEKSGVIYRKKTSIIYDPNPPRVSNLVFTDGINVLNSKYLPDSNKISFKFDSESLIPIKKYIVKISYQNSSILKEINNKAATINSNFSDAKSISISAVNVLDKLGNEISKNLLFDFDIPTISLIKSDNSMKLLCSDNSSGCKNILYSLSKTTQCTPSLIYNSSNLIRLQGYNFICAKSIDNVGHQSKTKLESIFFDFTSQNDTPGGVRISPDSNSNYSEIRDYMSNSSNDNTDNNLNQTINEPNKINDDPFAVDPGMQPKNDSNTTTYVLISALILLFASVGGSGYYAYKKGYLNDELEKLGIKLPKINSNPNNINKINQSSNYYNNVTRDTNKNIPVTNNTKNEKPNYDYHLNKLNSFIDSELGRGSSLFDKFKSNSKKDNSKDTLIKREMKSSDLSSDNFDEIYSSSKKIDKNMKINKSLKKEAENFESFYSSSSKTKKKNKK